MKDYDTSEETLGYQTSDEPSNADKRLLVAGSKNVLIDYQRKVKSRSGYTRLGAANTALTEIRNAWTWNTSLGQQLAQRFYDDELEVYLTTVDTVEINAWTRIKSSWSTTKKLRSTTQINGGGPWWDATENIDLQIMVNGDDNIYEWGGGVAVVDSITGTTITKKGTTTFAQNHFYTTRNKVVICVRTGTEYTYTGGEGTTTLTGIADTTGLQADDILIQKVVTQTDKPVANFINDFVYNFENQIIYGSETSNTIYVSKNTDYTDKAKSSPRVAGEGETWANLSGPCRAINSVAKFVLIFCGLSDIFKAQTQEIAVGTTLTETFTPQKLDTGANQGALNHECVIPVGNSLAYISNEPALRLISNPDDLAGANPKTLSNPIKPDFDAEDWDEDQTYGMWYKNILIFTAAANSRMYMLNFIEDADGKLFRFWNPPQVLPVGPMSIIDRDNDLGPLLHGHSNAVPESYLLFDGASDGQYDDMAVENKLPINAVAVFAYNSYGKRGRLKTFDEYYMEGEITPSTEDLMLTLSYDYGGSTQQIEKTIDGSNEAILEGAVGFNSLAQQSLAVNPLGGLLNVPTDARKFRVVFEIAREDFFQDQAMFSTNEVDRFWSIIAHGANATLSPRKAVNIRN